MTAAERTLAGLLAAVCENPADDVPRLILADWYDDQGQEARAEFIRLGCELEALGTMTPGSLRNASSYDFGREAERDDRRAIVIRRRLLELQSSHKSVWWSDYGGPKVTVLEWTRGFTSHVAMTCADWLESWDQIVRLQPIEKVTLTKLTPTFRVAGIYQGVRTKLQYTIESTDDIRKYLHGEWPRITFTLAGLL